MPTNEEQKTINTYNEIAPVYAKNNNTLNYWKEEIEYFQSQVPQGNILEVGSGHGRDSLYFSNKNYQYIGIDASSGLIEVAKKNHPNTIFLNYNMDEMRMLKKQAYDGLWCAATLLHIPKRNMNYVLTSMRERLKKEATMFVSVKEVLNCEDSTEGFYHFYNGKMWNEEDYSSIRQELDNWDDIETEEDKISNASRFFAFYTEEEFTNILEQSFFKIKKFYKKEFNNTIWLCYFVQPTI